MATLYDVLGVSPRATSTEIRRAYHDLARSLHPDRAQATGLEEGKTQRRMQEVNDAWRVLRDQNKRAAYDRRVLGLKPMAPSSASATATAAEPVVGDEADLDDTPYPSPHISQGLAVFRLLPWLALAAVLAIIFVFTAFAGGDKKVHDLTGRCVSLAGGSTSEVPCEGPNDGKVALVVDRSSRCPDNSEPRSVAGDKWLCLRPLTTVPGR